MSSEPSRNTPYYSSGMRCVGRKRLGESGGRECRDGFVLSRKGGGWGFAGGDGDFRLTVRWKSGVRNSE